MHATTPNAPPNSITGRSRRKCFLTARRSGNSYLPSRRKSFVSESGIVSRLKVHPSSSVVFLCAIAFKRNAEPEALVDLPENCLGSLGLQQVFRLGKSSCQHSRSLCSLTGCRGPHRRGGIGRVEKQSLPRRFFPDSLIGAIGPQAPDGS